MSLQSTMRIPWYEAAYATWQQSFSERSGWGAKEVYVDSCPDQAFILICATYLRKGTREVSTRICVFCKRSERIELVHVFEQDLHVFCPVVTNEGTLCLYGDDFSGDYWISIDRDFKVDSGRYFGLQSSSQVTSSSIHVDGGIACWNQAILQGTVARPSLESVDPSFQFNESALLPYVHFPPFPDLDRLDEYVNLVEQLAKSMESAGGKPHTIEYLTIYSRNAQALRKESPPLRLSHHVFMQQVWDWLQENSRRVPWSSALLSRFGERKQIPETWMSGWRSGKNLHLSS